MGREQLAHLRIVLVEPAGPINVGSVARIMKNMGLHDLVLVNPQCDLASPAAWHMAVHGQDVLAAAQTVKSLPEALVGCQRAAATTGRIHPQHHGLEPPEAVIPWLLPPHSSDPMPTALIFGPEDRGLSNEELIYAQRWIRIPTSEVYPSLNLAQAVAVCSYLLHRQATDPAMALASPTAAQQATATSPPKAAAAVAQPTTLDQLEGFHQDLEAILLKIGYLYPHTAASRMAKLRQLLHRAEPNAQELAMLRGVLRQVNWAINQVPPSS